MCNVPRQTRMSETWCAPHRYLLRPASARARVRRERTEQPLRSRARPRLAAHLTLDTVTLNLTSVSTAAGTAGTAASASAARSLNSRLFGTAPVQRSSRLRRRPRAPSPRARVPLAPPGRSRQRPRARLVAVRAFLPRARPPV